jgi:uncharacterized protein (TIGR03663 family)
MTRFGGTDRTTAVVVGVAVVALSLRLVGLGERPFHWGEARVGVWALHFARTGAFEYRPVAGGPLPYHLARAAFAVLGPTDVTARLPVALVGGLLPLSALGLRGWLDDDETALLAVFLAVSPPLVSYGRTLRGDLLLAAAAFVACVLALRAVDGDGDRNAAYGVAVAAAIALAASGFVVATVACVGAAAVVAFDARRLPMSALRSLDVDSAATLAGRLVLVFAAVLVFLFAPRGDGVSLWSPLSVPAVLTFVFGDAPARFVAVRVAARYADGVTHPLLPYVISLLSTLLTVSLPTVLLGVYGALSDRYAGASRPVVLFFAAWAGLALVAVPTVTEVDAPWLTVHVVVPLAVPAAVGAARGLSVLRNAVAADDAATTATVLLVVVAVVAQVGGVLASDVYGAPTPESSLSGYAQPADDLDPFAANVSAVAAADTPTVLYYGDRFHTGQWHEADGPPVPAAWGNRLPLPWYVARAGGTATSLPSDASLPETPPPVVVADPGAARRVDPQLQGYERSRYRLALWNRDVVVFTRQ